MPSPKKGITLVCTELNSVVGLPAYCKKSFFFGAVETTSRIKAKLFVLCNLLGGNSYQSGIILQGTYVHLVLLDFKEVADWELCQLRFLWLMNQLLICFSCRPVSSTSFALSSSYEHATELWVLDAYCWIGPFGMLLPPLLEYRGCVPWELPCPPFPENLFSHIFNSRPKSLHI